MPLFVESETTVTVYRDLPGGGREPVLQYVAGGDRAQVSVLRDGEFIPYGCTVEEIEALTLAYREAHGPHAELPGGLFDPADPEPPAAPPGAVDYTAAETAVRGPWPETP